MENEKSIWPSKKDAPASPASGSASKGSGADTDRADRMNEALFPKKD